MTRTPSPRRADRAPVPETGGVAATVARAMPLLLLACTALVLAQWWVLARGPWGPPGAPPPPPYPPPPYPAGPPVVYYQPMPPPAVIVTPACACADCGCAPCYGCDCGGPGGCVCDLNGCGCAGCGVDCAAVPPTMVGADDGDRASRRQRPGPAAVAQSLLGGLGLFLPLAVLALWRRRR